MRVRMNIDGSETTTGGALLKNRKTPVLESFLNKNQAFMPATFLKRDSNTGV